MFVWRENKERRPLKKSTKNNHFQKWSPKIQTELPPPPSLSPLPTPRVSTSKSTTYFNIHYAIMQIKKIYFQFLLLKRYTNHGKEPREDHWWYILKGISKWNGNHKKRWHVKKDNITILNKLKQTIKLTNGILYNVNCIISSFLPLLLKALSALKRKGLPEPRRKAQARAWSMWNAN